MIGQWTIELSEEADLCEKAWGYMHREALRDNADMDIASSAPQPTFLQQHLLPLGNALNRELFSDDLTHLYIKKRYSILKPQTHDGMSYTIPSLHYQGNDAGGLDSSLPKKRRREGFGRLRLRCCT